MLESKRRNVQWQIAPASPTTSTEALTCLNTCHVSIRKHRMPRQQLSEAQIPQMYVVCGPHRSINGFTPAFAHQQPSTSDLAGHVTRLTETLRFGNASETFRLSEGS